MLLISVQAICIKGTKPNDKKDKREFKDEQLKKIKSKQSKGKGQGTTLYSALKKDHGKINKEQMISFEIRYLSL